MALDVLVKSKSASVFSLIDILLNSTIAGVLDVDEFKRIVEVESIATKSSDIVPFDIHILNHQPL